MKTEYRIVMDGSVLAIEMKDDEGHRSIIRTGIRSYDRAKIIRDRWQSKEDGRK